MPSPTAQLTITSKVNRSVAPDPKEEEKNPKHFFQDIFFPVGVESLAPKQGAPQLWQDYTFIVLSFFICPVLSFFTEVFPIQAITICNQ